MTIPIYDEAARALASGDFRTSAPATEALSFGRVRAALEGWQAQEMAQAERSAATAQAEQAEIAQTDLGPGEVAQPDPSLAARFQAAFRDRAREVYAEQAKLEGYRVASDLRRAHRLDPEGFASAWDAYVSEQEEVLKAQDPVLAAATRRMLERQGEGEYQNIAEAAHARELATQKQTAITLLSDRQALHADDLLNDPDEERYLAAMADIEDDLGVLLESGLMSASEAADFAESAQFDLTREWVRGEFTTSLQAGDLGGAQGVIEALRAGQWFPDNERGRTLAAALERELNALLAAEAEDVENATTLALHNLQRLQSAALLGLDASENEGVLEQSFAYVMEHGNPLQRQQAIERANAVGVARAAQPYIDNLPIYAIDDFRRGIDDSFFGVSETAHSALIGALEAHERKLNEALDQNDLLSMDRPLSPRAASADEVQARRERTAHLSGLPVSAVPHWRREETAEAGAAFDEALRTGRYDEADEILTNYLAPAINSPVEMAALAIQAGEAAGDMFTLAALSTLGHVDATTDLMALAAEGRTLDRAAVYRDTGADPDAIRSDSALNEAILTASMGRPDLADSMRGFLSDVYVAALQRARDRDLGRRAAQREAIAQVRRIAGTPLSEGVEFSNGSRLPGQVVASFPEGVDAVRREINEVLDNPARLGIPPSQHEDMRYWVAPTPLEDGSIGFYHTAQGRLVTDRNGDVVRVLQDEAIARAGVTPDTSPGFFQGLWEQGQQWVAEQEARWQDTRTLRTIEATAPEQADLLTDIYYAVKNTPPAERGWRISEYGLLLDAERDVDWAGVERGWQDAQERRRAPAGRLPPERQSLMVGDYQPLIAAQRLAQMQQRYPDDLTAQLVGYWEGEQVVESLRAEHGERWADHLPMGTRKFVERVRSRRHAD